MSQSNLILPQKSFAGSTKVQAKSNEIREKELDQREAYLAQEAEKIDNWKRKLSFDEQADERRKVELAMDFAVRSLGPNALTDDVIDSTRHILTSIDQLVTDRLAAKETVQSEAV